MDAEHRNHRYVLRVVVNEEGFLGICADAAYHDANQP